MKRILLSLSIIASVSVLSIGMTRSIFSDTEISRNNTFLTGTIDIDIDNENPWRGGLEIGDIKPGEEEDFEWRINNVGTYPANIWLAFENLTNTTGEQSEPECEAENGTWDEVNNLCSGMSDENNKLDEVLDYGLRVEVYGLNEAGKMWDQIIYARNYTLGEIKNLDIILGMIPVGGYMKVYQEFGFQYGAGNEYQGDITMFDIKIAAEQLKGTLVLENKSSTWEIQHNDGVQAILNYTTRGPEFGYNLIGQGMQSGIDYSLIYYADPWGSNQSILIGKEKAMSDGSLAMSGSKEISGNLPIISDELFPDGAKLWLVPSTWYNEDNNQMKHWNKATFLFETAMIVYEKTNYGPVVIPDAPSALPEAPASEGNSGPSAPTVKTLDFEDLGAVTQYGYWHDYSSADVSFAYSDPLAGENLQGTVTASGLKPYATYQLKFEGKPTCLYPAEGDDVLNSYLGSIGRWWDNDSNQNGNTAGNCVNGYLVWDYITADEFGNAVKSVQVANSFHVLFCSGGTCGLKNNDELKQPDAANSDVYFCDAEDVSGELEHPSVSPCGGLDMDAGEYDLRFVLNEESFHKSPGTWTAVMDTDIQFELK